MHPTISQSFRIFLTLVAIVFCLTSLQAQSQTAPDDVLRINTELVQTDVMVFDRHGQFVDGLKPEQFVLTLNGDAKKLSLFDRIISHPNSTTAQSKASPPFTAADNYQPKDSGSGRIIFFFIDDIHLSGESLSRARKALLHFVDNELYPEDRLALVSTSGQIGFLQQLLTIPPCCTKPLRAWVTSKTTRLSQARRASLSTWPARSRTEIANSSRI